jgi:hypothetical protein
MVLYGIVWYCMALYRGIQDWWSFSLYRENREFMPKKVKSATFLKIIS